MDTFGREGGPLGAFFPTSGPAWSSSSLPAAFFRFFYRVRLGIPVFRFFGERGEVGETSMREIGVVSRKMKSEK